MTLVRKERLAFNAAANQQEAWDTDVYWPTTFALAAGLGVIFRTEYRWIGIGIAAGQLVTLFATQPYFSRFGEGLGWFIVLGLLWIGCAWISGHVARFARHLATMRLAR